MEDINNDDIGNNENTPGENQGNSSRHVYNNINQFSLKNKPNDYKPYTGTLESLLKQVIVEIQEVRKQLKDNKSNNKNDSPLAAIASVLALKDSNEKNFSRLIELIESQKKFEKVINTEIVTSTGVSEPIKPSGYEQVFNGPIFGFSVTGVNTQNFNGPINILVNGNFNSGGSGGSRGFNTDNSNVSGDGIGFNIGGIINNSLRPMLLGYEKKDTLSSEQISKIFDSYKTIISENLPFISKPLNTGLDSVYKIGTNFPSKGFSSIASSMGKFLPVFGQTAFAIGLIGKVGFSLFENANKGTQALNRFTDVTQNSSNMIDSLGYQLSTSFSDWVSKFIYAGRGGPSQSEIRENLSTRLGSFQRYDEIGIVGSIKDLAETGFSKVLDNVSNLSRSSGLSAEEATRNLLNISKDLNVGLSGSNLSRFNAANMFTRLQETFLGIEIPLESFKNAILDNKDALSSFKLGITDIGAVNTMLSRASISDLTKLTLYAKGEGANIGNVSDFISDMVINKDYSPIGKILDPIVSNFKSQFQGSDTGLTTLDQYLKTLGISLSPQIVARMYQSPQSATNILADSGAFLTTEELLAKNNDILATIRDYLTNEKRENVSNTGNGIGLARLQLG